VNLLCPLLNPFFFAERENVFSFDGEVFRETIPEVEPFVVFGVHSCDLTGIAYQDKFFKEDPYYQARRKKALLVGIDCSSPCKQGFCIAVDAGPAVKTECADLILHLTDAGEWLLLVCTNTGRQAVEGMSLLSAKESDQELRSKQIGRCESEFGDLAYMNEGIRRLVDDSVPSLFWNEVGVQCLSCSGCTNLCPTCTCYGTRYLSSEYGSYQQRFWDSCLYEAFQREASQHNPTEQAGARLHRFWSHKFSRDTVNQFGRYGCVGCGRCEITCPGVIGAHSIMQRILSFGDEVC